MLFAYFAVIASIPEFNQPATVTYSNPGARLERLLPELSMACGQTLAASSAMQDQVLAVRLDRADTAQVLDKLAYAAWGKWRKDGERFILEPDEDGVSREEHRIAADYRQVIHRTLAKLQARLLPNQPTTDEWGRKLGPPTPAEIAAAKLVPALDEEVIAALPIKREIIYATKPRPLQHALPPNAEAIFENMVAEIQKLSPQTPKPRAGATPPIKRVPYKTDLVVRRSQYDYRMPAYAGPGGPPGLDMEITVYDANGKAVVSENVFAPRWEPAEVSRAPQFEKGPKALPIHQSEFTKSLLGAWHGPYLPKPGTQAWIANPLEHDPAEWFGCVLVDYANSLGRQLIVAVSDQAVSDVGSMPPEDLTDAFLRFLLQNGGATMDNAWVTMHRRLPTPDDTEPTWTITDRHRLQALVASARDPKLSPFWNAVRALRLGYNPKVDLPQWDLLGLSDWDWEPAQAELALLSDAQIATLLRGGKVLLSATPIAIQAAFSSEMSQGPSGVQNFFGPHLAAGMERFDRTRDVRGEYTEFADSYLPGTAYMYLGAKSNYGAFVSAPGMGVAGGMGAALSPFPIRGSATLAICYCIKPGFNVMGGIFQLQGL